jgi:hypothetical protein
MLKHLLLLLIFCFSSTVFSQGKLKVFILAGQSNAQGHGDLGPVTTAGTLEHFYAHRQDNEFDFIKDNNSNWATRSDVWVRYDTESNGLLADDLKVGYGGWSQQIGPEYGMGHALGKHFNDQVLIIKTAWGGKSLAVDFRPPSAGGTTGPYYTRMINDIKASMNNIATEFPEYNGETIEIAGFVWFQGWNDGGSDAYKAEYESNLLNLIKDVPVDLNVRDLPILVGLTGNGGRDTTTSDGWVKGLQTKIVPAQIGAVQSTPHSVIDYAETRDFWIEPSNSPGDGLHHWNNNAQSYLRIGDEFGKKIIELIEGKSTAPEGKLKIYILAGQSNMEGHGKISATPDHLNKNGGMGSLDYTIQNDNNNTFSHLKDSGGNYKIRDDVWVYYKRGGTTELKGDLSTQYGSDPTNIGPELQFGHLMGDFHGEQVLLIKTAWGGKSLANDFLPPSSVSPAGYASVPTVDGDRGFYFMETIRIVNDVLTNLETHFPGYDGNGYELAGFGWHQGWNDVIDQNSVNTYESNMRNFILDIRDSLGVPKLPFVVGLSGMHGPLSNFEGQYYEGRVVGLWNAQFAMADYTKYPDFADNVTTVDTRDYFRIPTGSPSDQGYHWSGNAESYFWIGDAMAKAMQGLTGYTQEECNGIPEGYIYLGDEGDTKTVPSTGDVAYGHGCEFTYLYNVSESVAINNGTFGDPAPGYPKKAYFKAIDIAISIDTETTGSRLSIYPKHAQNQVNIEGQFSHWMLTDVLGAVVKRGAEKVINVAHLNQGLYYLIIDGEVMKFIKI